MSIDVVSLLVGPIAALLDKWIPDKDAREKMAHEIATMAEKHSFELTKEQIRVNQQEAAHKSLFVAGWRPYIGWTLGFSMSFNYMIAPLINWGTALYGSPVVLPVLEFDVMMPVLLGMLGLGVMRTGEKIKGVARER